MSTRGHFTIIDNAIIREENLSVYDKMVYTVLCMFSDVKTRSCYPSYETIAKHVGCHRRTVIKVMQNLVELGYITKITKAEGKKNTHACNLYIINPIVPEEAAEEETTANAENLPGVQGAFPKVVFDEPETLPDVPHTPPGACDSPEQYPLNKNHLNKHLSVRSPYGDRDEILEKLDKHFNYGYFKHQKYLHEPYKVIVSYMAEMLTDEYTRIGGADMHQDEIARYLFHSMNTGTLADFLEYLQKLAFSVKPRKPNAYFKTVLIEYVRENQIFFPQHNALYDDPLGNQFAS